MKKQISRAAILLLLLTTIMVFSCGKSGGNGYNSTTPTPPATVPANAVEMRSMAFSPSALTVTAGTTVTWENKDNMAHTVTADDKSFDSGNIAAAGKFSMTFTTAGTFAYHCTYHSGMTASIIVK